MNAIVDTDVLLGLFNTNDANHLKAVALARVTLDRGINIFILPTTLCEFALLASSRIGAKQAQQAVSTLTTSDYLGIDINEEITKEAVTLYEQQTSKEESLFDCFIMIAAKKIKADFILSFDRGYVKRGFTLLGNSHKERN